MHQFVSAVNPSNISPTHRTQFTQYMQANTACMGSTKRPLARVLPAIGSEKLNNVPRLLRMDICIYSYLQLYSPSNISPLDRTQCTQYMQAHTVCMRSTKRPLVPVLPAIGSETLTNVPRLLKMDICINSYRQLTPQTSVLPTGPNAHGICTPILHVWEA